MLSNALTSTVILILVEQVEVEAKLRPRRIGQMAVEVTEDKPEDVTITRRIAAKKEEVSEISVTQDVGKVEETVVRITPLLAEEDVSEVTIGKRERPSTTVVAKQEESSDVQQEFKIQKRRVVGEEVAEETLDTEARVTMRKAPVSKRVEETEEEHVITTEEHVTETAKLVKKTAKTEEHVADVTLTKKVGKKTETTEEVSAKLVKKPVTKKTEEHVADVTLTKKVGKKTETTEEVSAKLVKKPVTKKTEEHVAAVTLTKKKGKKTETKEKVSAKLVKAKEEVLPAEKTEQVTQGADLF